MSASFITNRTLTGCPDILDKSVDPRHDTYPDISSPIKSSQSSIPYPSNGVPDSSNISTLILPAALVE